MARTKQEVRNFLQSQVGRIVSDKSNGRLNGQCVALIKALMEFLGVDNPYAARGNAKDVGDTYIRQGIGTAGRGWLTICVNRNMGGGYGHVWVDLLNEANYEQNGAQALRTTKNTRPVQQAQQFVNFDKWIREDPAPATGNRIARGGTARVLVAGLNVRNAPSTGAAVAATYVKGQTFNYDSYIITNGYVWLSYVSNSGVRRYVAEGPFDGNRNNIYVSGGIS